MLAAFWRSKTLFLDFGARRLAAARFIAELEILLPEIPEPKAIDYEPDDYARIEQQWREDCRKRNELKQQLFQQYFNSRKLTVLKWLWRRIKSVFGAGKNPKRTSNIVPISDLRGLDASRAYIKRYFENLSGVQEDENKAFIATAEFRTGYLAPLFLITGLINRFGEAEGWKLILDNYRQLVKGDAAAYSSELVKCATSSRVAFIPLQLLAALGAEHLAFCACEAWKPGDGS